MHDKGHMGNHNNAHRNLNREVAMNTRTNRSGSGHFGGLVIGQIPDAFTQNGIDHRPYLILSTPYGIEISHVNVSNELKYGESR